MRAIIAQSEETACKKVLRKDMMVKYPILQYFSLQWFSQKLRIGRDNKKRYIKAQEKESKVNNDQSRDSTFNVQHVDFFCQVMPKNPFDMQREVDFKALARLLFARAAQNLPDNQAQFAMAYLTFLEGGAQADDQEKDSILGSATELLKSDWVQAKKDKKEPSFNKKLFASLPVVDQVDAHRQVIE